MKKILIHAKNGFVSIIRCENNKVLVKKGLTVFETTSTGTIGNTMASIAMVMDEVSKEDGIFELATIGIVADKINSDILVKEYRSGIVLSSKRELTALEKEVYESLIAYVGRSYGKVLVKSENYISKTTKPGQTQDQAEWAKMFETATQHVDKLIADSVATAPEMEVVFEDEASESLAV